MICYSLLLFGLAVLVAAESYQPESRWAQASVVIQESLYIHGGLSDPYNTYSYTSAPETNQLLLLDLSFSFNASTPPWELINVTNSPSLGWHTLSAFNESMSLLFGGQPGPNSPTPLTTLNDSAQLLVSSNRSEPLFIDESQNWADEPMRRIHHSASSTDGLIWIIGGEKADGSGEAFDDHYVFDPATVLFTMLPTQNAPPAIYGHVSLVLQSGTLVVLGGYDTASSQLVPLDTIWLLDTTQTTLSWEAITLSSSDSPPNPRRDFAAVVLASGEILIHGGGDATLQTTYADGWILHTSGSTDTWYWEVVEALEQIGPRKDHFAAWAGGCVVFGFGYTSSGPAPAAPLPVYDPTSSVISPSYTPAPSASPPPTTLPLPSQTPGPVPTADPGGGGNGSGGGSGDGDGGSSSSQNTKSHQAALIVGTVIGAVAFAALLVGIVWFLRHRERGRREGWGGGRGGVAWLTDPAKGNEGRFYLLQGQHAEDGVDATADGASQLTRDPASVQRNISSTPTSGLLSRAAAPIASLAALTYNLLPTRRQQGPPLAPRRDMFADEDAYASNPFIGSAAWRSRPLLTRREGSEGTAWSLRSVGAAVRGMMSREPSTGVNELGYGEKLADVYGEHIPEDSGDGEGSRLMGSDFNPYTAAPLDPSRRKPTNESTWTYTDPFADPTEDEQDAQPLTADITTMNRLSPTSVDDSNPTPESVLKDATGRPHPPPLNTLAPFAVEPHTLSPLPEASYRTGGSSDTSHASSIFSHSPSNPPSQGHSSNPRQSYANTPHTSFSSATGAATSAALQRHTSILNSVPPLSQPLRRSDTWWTRFARTPLLDRRSSRSSGAGGPLEFRDPNPAPPLSAIDEASKASGSPDSPESRVHRDDSGGSSASAQSRKGGNHSQGGSLNSGHTADSAYLGGAYDVVQRLASDGSESRRTRSTGSTATTRTGEFGVRKQGSDASNPPSSNSQSKAPTPPSKGPTPPLVMSPTRIADGPRQPVPARVASPPQRVKSPTIAERISNFEALGRQDPPSGGPRNTRKREEAPSRNRVSIQYGLAPRASLYVANPNPFGEPSE